MKCNYTAAADESGSRVVRERSMHKRVRQHARSIPVRSLSMQAAKLLPLTITAGSAGAALMVPHPYHGNSHPFSLGWLPVAAFGFIHGDGTFQSAVQLNIEQLTRSFGRRNDLQENAAPYYSD